MEKEILEIAKKLIGFKTVDGNTKEIAACFDYIKSYFSPEIASGKIIAKEYICNGCQSMVFSNKDALKFDVILSGHIDVVNADGKDFTPREENGKLYGRGAGDMKSQVAAMMLIFKEIIDIGISKPVALMLNSCEETSGRYGVKYLIEDIGYRTNVAIYPDGGNKFELNVKDKGLLWAKISAKGRSAHGSRPWLGENAILKLMDFYRQLEKIFPPAKKSKLLYQEGITVNLGKIAGGKGVNAVPEEAEMYLDIRYSEEKHKKMITEKIKKLVKKMKLNLETVEYADVFETDPNNAYIKKFKAIMEKNIGRRVKITKSTGAGDNRFFSQKNIPVIVTEPDLGGEHGNNEWIEIKGIEKLYKAIKEFVVSL